MKGFAVSPQRRGVKQTLARLKRNRRLAKDFEQNITLTAAWLFIAPIQIFARRVARSSTYDG